MKNDDSKIKKINTTTKTTEPKTTTKTRYGVGKDKILAKYSARNPDTKKIICEHGQLMNKLYDIHTRKEYKTEFVKGEEEKKEAKDEQR